MVRTNPSFSLCLVSHIPRDVYFQPLLPQAYIPGDTLRMNPSFLSKASFDTEHPTASLFDSPLSGFSSDDSSFGTPPSAFSTPMLLPGSPMMLDGIESHPSTPSNVPAAATLPSDPKGRRRTRSDTTHRVEKKPRSKAIHSPARAREPSSEEEVCDPERTEEEHIKRPPNAFICFRTHFYGTVVRVEKHNANISQSAGKAWAALSAEKKAPHYAKAKFLKEEHKRKYPYWKYRPKKSKGPKKPRKSPKKYENDNVLVEAYLDGKRGEDYQKQVEEEGRLGERCLPAGAEERKRAKLEGAVKTPRPMAAKPSKPKARRVTARNEPIPSEFRFNPQISKKVTLRKEHQLVSRFALPLIHALD